MRDVPTITRLVKQILRYQNYAYISMMTAFCKQMAYFLGIHFV